VSKSIIIIGAGVAGLAAGCYARMNGYRTQIFELHTLPGGLCTAWERKDYVFEGCLHYLLGSGAGQPYNDIWQELGVAQTRRWIDHDEAMRVIDGQGRQLVVHVDPDKLEAEMKALSPQDSRTIETFTKGIRQFRRFDMSLLQRKPRSLMGMLDWAQLGWTMMPFLGPLLRWAPVSAQDFANRFRDPFLRRAVAELFGWSQIPMMGGLSLLAAMSSRNAGVPEGASLEFARTLEKRFLDLGGELEYRAQVEKILVERDDQGRARAAGVRLYDDREFMADHVVSAADGYSTIFYMLGGEFLSRSTRRHYDGHLPMHSQIQVSLGVARDVSQQAHWVTHLLDKPIRIAGEDRTALMVKNYCFDPSLAPAGKSVIVVMMPTSYGYWQRIYGHRLYDTEQDQVAEIVIDFLEGIYPGLRKDIEVVDVATPLSYERYTGNWQGASSGWLLAKQTMLMNLLGVEKTLPGLDDFYMAGQWVEPGGMVPVVAMSGRNVIRMICHHDRQPFVAARPG